MRRILIDNARRKGRLRRGGEMKRVSLDDPCLAEEAQSWFAAAFFLTQFMSEEPQKRDLYRRRGEAYRQQGKEAAVQADFAKAGVPGANPSPDH
jgi:hypothetical protein